MLLRLVQQQLKQTLNRPVIAPNDKSRQKLDLKISKIPSSIIYGHLLFVFVSKIISLYNFSTKS
jgi:hypothetical protein